MYPTPSLLCAFMLICVQAASIQEKRFVFPKAAPGAWCPEKSCQLSAGRVSSTREFIYNTKKTLLLYSIDLNRLKWTLQSCILLRISAKGLFLANSLGTSRRLRRRRWSWEHLRFSFTATYCNYSLLLLNRDFYLGHSAMTWFMAFDALASAFSWTCLSFVLANAATSLNADL